MRRAVITGAAVLLLCLHGILSEAQTVNTTLSSRQQAIVPIAAFAASGQMPALKTALHDGLDGGLTVNEIKEILVQLYAYAGFPRSLNALGALQQVLGEREAKGIHDKPGKEAGPLSQEKTSLERGTEVQTALVGAPVKGGLMDFAPAVDEFLKAHLFGDIFGRDNLDWQSREIATVSALASMDGVESQLRSHCRISRNVGLTAEQMQALAAVLRVKVSDCAGKKVEVILKEEGVK